MITEPACYKRGCVHYIGVSQPDGTELTEVNVCKAYPDGIPADICEGTDLHQTRRPDQTGNFVFETETGRK